MPMWRKTPHICWSSAPALSACAFAGAISSWISKLCTQAARTSPYTSSAFVLHWMYKRSALSVPVKQGWRCRVCDLVAQKPHCHLAVVGLNECHEIASCSKATGQMTSQIHRHQPCLVRSMTFLSPLSTHKINVALLMCCELCLLWSGCCPCCQGKVHLTLNCDVNGAS